MKEEDQTNKTYGPVLRLSYRCFILPLSIPPPARREFVSQTWRSKLVRAKRKQNKLEKTIM